MPSNINHKITDYGEKLAVNKRILSLALGRLGMRQRCIMTAMCMLETDHMEPKQRDASKDHDAYAANVSIFNLSVDMLKQLGYKGSCSDLNCLSRLDTVVQLLEKAFKQWGEEKTLAFVRGGRTAFEDLKSYGARAYMQTIWHMASVIEKDIKLLTDGRRVEVYLPHV
jgi:hypothetical protein